MQNKKNFKIGASVCIKAPSGAAFPIVDSNIYRSIEWLSSNGFDSIEVHIPSPDLVDAYKLRDYIDSKGMCASSIGTGLAVAYEQLVITSRDKSVRYRAIERLKRQCDLGAVLDCPVVIGSMRGNILEGDTLKDTDRRMVEACKELAEYAEKVKTDIVIEAIDRSETNYLKTAQDVLELIEKVGSDRLKVHLDTFHMNIEETDWRMPVLACGRHLGHVHIADNTRLYPGSGMIDFVPFLQALNDIGYQGSLIMEIYPGDDGYKACILGREHILKCIEKIK